MELGVAVLHGVPVPPTAIKQSAGFLSSLSIGGFVVSSLTT